MKKILILTNILSLLAIAILSLQLLDTAAQKEKALDDFCHNEIIMSEKQCLERDATISLAD